MTTTTTNSTETSWFQRLRLPVLLLVLVGLYVYSRESGLLEQANPEQIRTVVQQWGAYGMVLFVVLFSIGQLLYVPGMFFVIAAGLIYGGIAGFTIAMVGALVAITVSFYTVRMIGGSPLQNTQKPFIGRMLQGLHDHPIRSIATMRLIVSTAPWLNYILALSAVQYRQYIIGSVIGMVVPIALTVYFTDWLLVRIF